jgi:SM-20-related protein
MSHPGAVVLTGAWDDLRCHDHPYRWLATPPGQLLALDTAERLCAARPTGAFVRREADAKGSDKTYRNYSRQLVAPDGTTATEGLSRLWLELVDELCSAAYRHHVARVLNQPVVERVEVRLVRHAPGDWLGPHTDRPDKAFSHVFYLNPGWQESWGGALHILASRDPDDVVSVVSPELGASVLLARADNSWHRVGPVTAAAATERTSLLVHGLR